MAHSAGIVGAVVFAAVLAGPRADDKGTQVADALKFTVKSIDGKNVDLSKYQGKVVLVVNVASQCGYTPQYAGLQKLHEKYADKGLAVLGFPANEFGRQEPGTNEEIATFCKSKYDVGFDMFSKVVVKGNDINPFFKHLTDKTKTGEFGGPIGWNFEKFLIGKDGKVIGRYKSGVGPESDKLVKAIEEALAK